MVKLSIPFESLVESISELSLNEKYRLWEILEEQIAQGEESAFEQDPLIKAEMQEAREAYKAGDYETLNEYTTRRRGH